MRPGPPDAETPEARPDRRLPPLDRSVWRRWRTAVRAFAASEVGGRARKHEAHDTDLLAALRALGAENLVGRAGGLDVERDWDDLLWIDEGHLLSLALVLLAAPRFAVLDRSGLVLGPERGAHARALLAAAFITAVTCASDPARADQHDARLELLEGGRGTGTPLRAESRRT